MLELTIVLLHYVLSSSYISGIMSGPDHTCSKCLQMVISKRICCLCDEGMRSRKDVKVMHVTEHCQFVVLGAL